MTITIIALISSIAYILTNHMEYRIARRTSIDYYKDSFRGWCLTIASLYLLIPSVYFLTELTPEPANFNNTIFGNWHDTILLVYVLIGLSIKFVYLILGRREIQKKITELKKNWHS